MHSITSQQSNGRANPSVVLFDSKQSTGASAANQDSSIAAQVQTMNQSAVKLGALILKLENLIETCPAFKTGDQAALMQMSLVKEQHFVLND